MAMATLVNRLDIPDPDRHPRALVTGVVLSLALHLGIAGLLTYSPWAERETTPPEFVVDVVELPKPPKHKAPAPPPLPPPPAPAVQAPPPPAASLPPPPPPQLVEAPIADKSAPPPHKSLSNAAPRVRPSPLNAPHRTVASASTPLPVNSANPESTPVTIGPHHVEEDSLPSGHSEDKAAQTIPDFILMQIAQHWVIDYRNPRYRNIVLRGARIVLLPNGMLAPPLGKNDPWNPRAMIANYDDLLQPGAQTLRQALETFLQALRLAQPFRLPPDGKPNDKPRVFEIYFRLGDIPSAEAAGH